MARHRRPNSTRRAVEQALPDWAELDVVTSDIPGNWCYVVVDRESREAVMHFKQPAVVIAELDDFLAALESERQRILGPI